MLNLTLYSLNLVHEGDINTGFMRNMILFYLFTSMLPFNLRIPPSVFDYNSKSAK